VKRLAAIEKTLLASPDKQISLTDPDCRSMAMSGRGLGMVAYNVQSAIDITNHLIVAHDVGDGIYAPMTGWGKRIIAKDNATNFSLAQDIQRLVDANSGKHASSTRPFANPSY
jgi:hypothetical protein